MSISPRSGTRGLQRLICLKYYNVLKWESGSILGRNAAKIANYNRKLFVHRRGTKLLHMVNVKVFLD